MTAAEAARKIRANIKKSGGDPKGAVRVVNTEFYTEVRVNALRLTGISDWALLDGVEQYGVDYTVEVY